MFSKNPKPFWKHVFYNTIFFSLLVTQNAIHCHSFFLFFWPSAAFGLIGKGFLSVFNLSLPKTRVTNIQLVSLDTLDTCLRTSSLTILTWNKNFCFAEFSTKFIEIQGWLLLTFFICLHVWKTCSWNRQ